MNIEGNLGAHNRFPSPWKPNNQRTNWRRTVRGIRDATSSIPNNTDKGGKFFEPINHILNAFLPPGDGE